MNLGSMGMGGGGSDGCSQLLQLGREGWAVVQHRGKLQGEHSRPMPRLPSSMEDTGSLVAAERAAACGAKFSEHRRQGSGIGPLAYP